MSEVLLALFVGVATGLIFSFFKLPLPAPSVLPGVVGIVGIYVGSLLFSWVAKLL
jgi:XapX domain-containing protein